jgi:hypothetical protein
MSSAGFFFGLRLPLKLELSVADRLRQHLAKLSLGFRGLARERFLPLCHLCYVGMPTGDLKPGRARRLPVPRAEATPEGLIAPDV